MNTRENYLGGQTKFNYEEAKELCHQNLKLIEADPIINLTTETSSNMDQVSIKQLTCDNAMTSKTVEETELVKKKDIIEKIYMLQKSITEKLNSGKLPTKDGSSTSKMFDNDGFKGDNQRHRSISLINEALMKLQKKTSYDKFNINNMQDKKTIKPRSLLLGDNENIEQINYQSTSEEKNKSRKNFESFSLDDECKSQNTKSKSELKNPTEWCFENKSLNRRRRQSQYEETFAEIDRRLSQKMEPKKSDKKSVQFVPWVKGSMASKLAMKFLQHDLTNRQHRLGLPRSFRCRSPSLSNKKQPLSALFHLLYYKRNLKKNTNLMMKNEKLNLMKKKSYSYNRTLTKTEPHKIKPRIKSNNLVDLKTSRVQNSKNKIRQRHHLGTTMSKTPCYNKTGQPIKPGKKIKNVYTDICTYLLKQQAKSGPSVPSKQATKDRLKSGNTNVTTKMHKQNGQICAHRCVRPQYSKKMHTRRSELVLENAPYYQNKDKPQTLTKRQILLQKCRNYSQNREPAFFKCSKFKPTHNCCTNVSLFLQEKPMTNRNNGTKNYWDLFKSNKYLQRAYFTTENMHLSVKHYYRRRTFTTAIKQDLKPKRGQNTTRFKKHSSKVNLR